MKTQTISLIALLLFAASACTTTVSVSVHQPSTSSALTGTNCKLERELRTQAQKTDYWCWAASAHTVIEYLKGEPNERQSDLVDAVLRVQLDEAWQKAIKKGADSHLPPPNCEMAVSTTPTDQPDIQIARSICWTNGWPEDVFYTEAFRMHFEGYEYDRTSADPQGLTWDEIVAEICADRPMISAMHFSLKLGGGAHVVVIGGYTELEDGTQWVHVYDPGFNTEGEESYLWPYDVYLGNPGVFTHVRDYKYISLP